MHQTPTKRLGMGDSRVECGGLSVPLKVHQEQMHNSVARASYSCLSGVNCLEYDIFCSSFEKACLFELRNV